MTPRAAALALAGATAAVSLSAIFIRIAHDDAATIVWARMAIAALILAPAAARSFLRRGMPAPAQLSLVPLSGLLLAAHFLLWTASLAFTSVAASVLLVSLHPLIVAPLGRRLLGEQPRARTYAGMALALAGTVVTCVTDVRVDARALLGDLMAIGGAVSLAGYLIIGRGVRESMSVTAYSAIAYAVVAAVAAVTAGVFGVAHVPSPRVLALCCALAVVCTIGGHTVYNWTLRHVDALVVSVAFLGEPPLAALLAVLLLAAVPSAATVIGGLLILAGLALAVAQQRQPAAGDAPAAVSTAG